MDGLSIKDAAVALGLSEKTVRNRIRAGTLPARKAERPQGYEWRVYPDGLPGSLGEVVPPGTHVVPDGKQVEGEVVPPGNELATALALVSDLTRRNEQLAGQVGFLQARVQDQEATIQRLLAAPKEDEPAVEVEHTPRRRWWEIWK